MSLQPNHARKRLPRARHDLELLEGRCLLTVTLTDGLLSVTGDDAGNVIGLTVEHRRIQVLIDGAPGDPDNPDGFARADVQTININGLGGDDTITVSRSIKLPSTISGGDGDDTIFAGSGDDSVNGGDDDDVIGGGQGDDAIDGGPDDDTINGEDGHDLLSGGDGDDLLIGLKGNDTLSGDADDDLLDGGAGHDVAQGGLGRDMLLGGAGRDVLQGGDDEDVLLGGASNDQLSGGDNGDALSGDRGHDLLEGDGGDDMLRSSPGRDTLTGGDGEDLFGPLVRGNLRTDFTPGTDFDADTPVTVGDHTDPGLEGIRTDLLPLAPDVNFRPHQDGDIDYSAYNAPHPPTYGPHHGFDPFGADSNPGVTPRPTGVYGTEQPDEDLVHNLEHGHVWLSYDPAFVEAHEVALLEFLVSTFAPRSGIILTPREANDSAIELASWAHLDTLSDFDLDDLVEFILANRGHAPEGFLTP